jgi:hypothetical protein
MPRVLIMCHVTNKPLPTGLVLEASTFAATLGHRIAPPCPHCQATHGWTKATAWLEHLVSPTEDALPETRERRCPACQSEQIAPVGRVIAADGLILAEHRCEVCGRTFLILERSLA